MGKAAGKNKQQMVFRIFHYKERYHFDLSEHKSRNKDRFKTGPPKYVKKYIGRGTDEETINYCKQFHGLRSHKNYDTLCTIYDELLDIAAYQGEEYRGYILDGSQKPADIKTISGLIPTHRDIKVLRNAIKALLEVRLIECVMDKCRCSGKHPAEHRQPTGRNRKPPYIKDKHKSANGNRQKLKRNNNRQEPNIKPKLKKKTIKKISQTKGQNQPQGQGPKPNKPTESEIEQGQKHASHAAPVHSAINFKQTSQLTESHATSFATAIYEALKVPAIMGTTKGEREYQSFAAAWNRAQKAGLGLPLLQKLWNASVKSAERIGNRRQRGHWKKSPEATWMYEFNQRLKAYRAGKVDVSDEFRNH